MGIRIVGTASPEGTLDFKGKCRGDKKVLALILEKMKELGYNGGRVIIAHNQNEAALQLKMRIEERFGTFNGVIHPERALCFALLTNDVYNGRENRTLGAKRKGIVEELVSAIDHADTCTREPGVK